MFVSIENKQLTHITIDLIDIGCSSNGKKKPVKKTVLLLMELRGQTNGRRQWIFNNKNETFSISLNSKNNVKISLQNKTISTVG